MSCIFLCSHASLNNQLKTPPCKRKKFQTDLNPCIFCLCVSVSACIALCISLWDENIFFYSSLYHKQCQQCTIIEAENYHFILLGLYAQEEVGRYKASLTRAFAASRLFQYHICLLKYWRWRKNWSSPCTSIIRVVIYCIDLVASATPPRLRDKIWERGYGPWKSRTHLKASVSCLPN